ncbi:MAG: hypothetical protein QXI12_12875 [Candidatus Methanomethyliaceae archaeon]
MQSERQLLLEKMANIFRDYRCNDIPKISVEHVDRWISQFRKDIQLPILRECIHVFEKSYLSRARTKGKVRELVKSLETYVNTLPHRIAFSDFLDQAIFLQIPNGRCSQVELLSLLDEVLQENYGKKSIRGLKGKPGTHFVYLDDVVYTGRRLREDLRLWLSNHAPTFSEVYILLIAYMPLSIGQPYSFGKQVKWHYVLNASWRLSREFDLLWPTSVPDDEAMKNYVELRGFVPRKRTYSQYRLFSSEEGRQLLEREFFIQGYRIIQECAAPSYNIRPLGYGDQGIGIGSMLVTYVNCPNSSPLVLWWGNPSYSTWHPLGKWYPLLPRRTYY